MPATAFAPSVTDVTLSGIRFNKKTTLASRFCLSAVPTGFEPAISALTGPHVRPLHHGTSYLSGRSLPYAIKRVNTRLPNSALDLWESGRRDHAHTPNLLRAPNQTANAHRPLIDSHIRVTVGSQSAYANMRHARRERRQNTRCKAHLRGNKNQRDHCCAWSQRLFFDRSGASPVASKMVTRRWRSWLRIRVDCFRRRRESALQG